MPNVMRKMPPFSGDLAVVHIPHMGFYANGLPKDLSPSKRAHGIWLETCLRARLSTKGFWRGLHGSGVFGVGRLYASVIRVTGSVEHLGLLSTKVITTAGVTFLRDDWNANAQDFTTFNFHGCGTGAVAEAVGDIALGTEQTTNLNPASTRATGTRSVPSATSFASVGTLTFAGVAAITEHGVLSQAATGGGTLWDRSVFAAINVAALDSIQFTYTCTLTAGG